jgi:hypothetical protein
MKCLLNDREKFQSQVYSLFWLTQKKVLVCSPSGVFFILKCSRYTETDTKEKYKSDEFSKWTPQVKGKMTFGLLILLYAWVKAEYCKIVCKIDYVNSVSKKMLEI